LTAGHDLESSRGSGCCYMQVFLVVAICSLKFSLIA